jgi:predicted Zn-dependent protease
MKSQGWFFALLLTFMLCGLYVGAQDNQAVATPISNGKKAKPPATKDDIQSIGNRNIGEKGIGNWYSLEQEIGMGRQYSQEVEACTPQLRDPIIREYVNRIGQNLVRNSDAKVPFSIKILDSDEINAFALPGGFLYVNSGLILAAESEAELAGVMAHEIAHVAAHHATRQMTRSQMFTFASLPLVFVGGGVGVAVQQAAGLAKPLSMTKFSRGFETEADYLGVEYLYKAGYDPQAFISFFERVQLLERQKPGLITKAFASHPQTRDRVRKTQGEITKILPPRESYVISTSEFDDVRLRLATISSRHLVDLQDPNLPTLRREPSADEVIRKATMSAQP